MPVDEFELGPAIVSFGLYFVRIIYVRESTKGLSCKFGNFQSSYTHSPFTHSLFTVTPRYNAVVGRHLLGPHYKRGTLWDPVDLFDNVPGQVAKA